MSDGEFIVPTEGTDNKTIMIVGIVVSILLIGTFCCYQKKWLFFKQRNKTVEPKIEHFQKTAVNYDSKVEAIVEDLMKAQGLYTSNNKYTIQNIIKNNKPFTPKNLYDSYHKSFPHSKKELIGKIRGMLMNKGLILKIKGKVSQILSDNDKQVTDEQIKKICLRISGEQDGGKDFFETCEKVASQGPVPVGADTPMDNIVSKLMSYTE
tara:strand:- start:16333 stop:16956 length:624 start_codon:yes stop_codon:yes gene_type:complete